MATESTSVQSERYEAPRLTVLGTFQELTAGTKTSNPVDGAGHTSGAAASPGTAGTYGGR